ncbi:MAG TPA: prenyltransferase/squalene oxidase repeat-containing protein [Thermoguttaceae bacterium]|nr:prenyltransferase/squalene oxidase repeat-containing protein [Thermoguttaceae bacterium]
MTTHPTVLRRTLSLAVLAMLSAPSWAMAAKPTDGGAKPAAWPLATVGPRPNPVPTPKPEAIDESIRRGVEFLLARQNNDGSWGSARNTKGLNIYAPVPGAHQAFRAAVTSLAISSLVETRSDDPKVVEAIDRGEAWLIEHLGEVRRANAEAIYNNWAHAYSIQALVRMFNRHPDDEKLRKKIRELLEQQLDLLQRYECVDGGWCYYDFEAHTQKPSGSTISFVTATVLVALDEAKQVGVQIPEKLIHRAMDSIRRQRNPDFSYCYGEYLKYSPRMGINRPGGSLGRSQSCSLAMRLWGDKEVTDEVLTTWLDRLFARNLWLDIGRKRPIPHESWFQVAGYFFYYGHYYAALCIEQLEPSERPRHQDQLAQVLLEFQEKDGSWWDYPFYDYHQQYGTAFAIMSLVRCRHAPAE